MTSKVFITGASSGLGEGMARHLAARGCALVLAARRTDKLEALASELTGSGATVTTLALDVTNYESIAPALQRGRDALGGLDVVIANAGIAVAARVGKGQFNDARRVIETDLIGAMATVDAAVALFREQGHGHVVGVSSVAGVRGLPGQGAYSAAKGGLSLYLEAARAELAGSGIEVTDLAPGFIDTDLNRAMKSRPFVVSAERGTAAMVDLIEKKVGFRYVPVWPWSVVAQLLKILPARLLG